jgi:adenine C2-methylase RlmN of 23S rRNA A2503 and tRNA A37
VFCIKNVFIYTWGQLGFSGHLSASEIQEQVWHAKKITKIDRITFMGMGEPLANYDELLKAVNGLNDREKFNLSKKKMQISTVGFNPKKIKQMAIDMPTVQLAISLHASNSVTLFFFLI